MRKPITSHTLISEVHKTSGDYVLVDVLRVDESLNMATKTGIACTINIPKSDLKQAMKECGFRSFKQMVGYPVICKVSYDISNVLGRSEYVMMG